jgi:3' terminal RNA ribose 2'-O-methyltransferase Hen1
MLLTITSTAPQADDLGYLLHKNPSTLFEKPLTFGTARVFYTEATAQRCSICLQVDIDTVGLVRGKGDKNTSAPLAQYISNRPYIPSSFLSVALNECFATALGGRSKERPERVDEKMPLAAQVVGLNAPPSLIRELFTPLGYTIETQSTGPLDERFPEWGESGLLHVTLTAQATVRDLLTHLYVLIPVLDNQKHYYIGDDEVEKLLRRGDGWLATHPAREMITLRYLRYRKALTSAALARLTEVEETKTPETMEAQDQAAEIAEETLETPVRLNDQRIAATVEAVRSLQPPAKRVIDLGCGEGRTMAALLEAIPGMEHVAGMDVATMPLEKAARRLRLERMNERERARVSLFQGSLVYRDARLSGYDVALLNEVIEHLEADRLATLVRIVFEYAHPRCVVVTTPNAEYNSVWPSLPAGKFRHADHRFEWTREQFQAWTHDIASKYGYTLTFSGIGPLDETRGTPTQMATFYIVHNGI